ncbi:hypothetical protein N7468_002793 [Penicillium chermesinum]|uniref:Uncharacterized protein n=1 Tax=Penicillium chermesinum TaxID=63820 RepID=A0A9W9TXY8_9EURO|nr:uncharacterized protein N7468_002793 [Penicillium chermesinum]KAJ5247810.1 hypothetical protein N7468_002793 [Penicillium chermesinum]
MNNENAFPGSLDLDTHDLAQVSSSGLARSPPVLPERPANRPPTTPNIHWKPTAKPVEEPLAEGLSNEDLWMLVRRFNKQIYHVKALPGASADLDLNRVNGEQFPPEKLRITLERFYTSVLVGAVEFFRHIGRLRSWKEPRRTSLFLAVYVISWWMDLILPTFLSLLSALVLFPPLRLSLFPEQKPVPFAKDGPAFGQPESHDSLTGVPEAHKGEAAEQEAKNLIDSVAKVALESAAARYGQTIPEEDQEEDREPESLAAIPTTTETPTEGASEDKTKQPIKKKVSHATDELMRILSDITDIYERFANLFVPTPPFYMVVPRLRLVGVLGVIIATIPFISSYWIVKFTAFNIGFAFFGGPVFSRVLALLDYKVPDWQQRIDLQTTLLQGVPTNAQLTLTLLRIGEINSSPLPPPPTSSSDSIWPMRRNKSKATLASQSSTGGSTSDLQHSASDPLPAPKPETAVFDTWRLTVQWQLLGMLQHRQFASTPFGPLKFDAKYERKRGAAVIDSEKEPPILYFTTYQSAGLDDLRIESRKKGSVLFQIPVTDIRELKKTEGLGWKGKLVVELTAGSKEAADGLIVTGNEEGQKFHLTGMRSRNQLFNRLVAIDAQYWESW